MIHVGSSNSSHATTPYSPNLARSDCYLFGTVKERLEWMQVSDAGMFVEQVHEILGSTAVEELERVFGAWIDRVC
jgi:hypothetical protein